MVGNDSGYDKYPKELQVQLGRAANKTVAQVSLGEAFEWMDICRKETVKQSINVYSSLAMYRSKDDTTADARTRWFDI